MAAFEELLDKAARELRLQHQRELDDNAAVLSLQHNQEKAVLAEELRELRERLESNCLSSVSERKSCGNIDIGNSTDASSRVCNVRHDTLDSEILVVPLRRFQESVLHAAIGEDEKLVSHDAVLEDVDDLVSESGISPPNLGKAVPPAPTGTCPALEPSERQQTLKSSCSNNSLGAPGAPVQTRRPSHFDLSSVGGEKRRSLSQSMDSATSTSWNLDAPMSPKGPIRSVLKRRTLEFASAPDGAQNPPRLALGRSPYPHKSYTAGENILGAYGDEGRLHGSGRSSVMSVNLDDRRMSTLYQDRRRISSVLEDGQQYSGRHGHRMSVMDEAIEQGELHPEIMSLIGHRMSVTGNTMEDNLRRRVTWVGEHCPDDNLSLAPTETVPENPHEDEEEEQVEMLPIWKSRRKSLATSRSRTTERNSFKQVTPLDQEVIGSVDVMSDSSDERPSLCVRMLKHCVTKPSTSRRLLWDVFGVLLIGYDVFWIPMQAFDPEKTDVTSIIAWTSTIFWTLDIPASFLVGYHNEGVLEMRLSYIAFHYCRTWLPFDIVIVLIDWTLTVLDLLTETAVTAGADGVGYVRLGKAVRFLRLLRLLRLLKASGVLKEMLERIQSEAILILVGIGKLLLFILMINHIIACVWFGIGKAYDTGTWIKATDIESRNLLYQYSTSLHWSLTQFTPASMEVFPENEMERLFAVSVILTAMVAFSSFVSAITNAMTQLRNLNSERNTQFAQLRRYFAENKVSVPIMGRIYCCLQQVMSKSKSRVHEVDVTILQLLPWSLKSELLEEVYAPILSAHPFFDNLCQCHPVTGRKLLQSSVEEISKPIGQELFIAGEQGTKMYFVLSGYLSYTKERDEKDKDDSPQTVFLSAHQWCCEPVLWIKWKHVGQLLATSHCELVTLNSIKVGEVLSQLREEDDQVKRYVRFFVKYFKKYPDSLDDAFADRELIEDMTLRAFRGDDVDDDERPKLRSQKSFFGNRRISLFNGGGSNLNLGLRRSQSQVESNSDSEDAASEDSDSDDSDGSTHSAKSKASVLSKKSSMSTRERKSSNKGRSSLGSKASSPNKDSSCEAMPGEIVERSQSMTSLARKTTNGSDTPKKGETESKNDETSDVKRVSSAEKQPRLLARTMSETSNLENNEIDQWLEDLPEWRSRLSASKEEEEVAPKSKVARFLGWTTGKTETNGGIGSGSIPMQKMKSDSTKHGFFKQKLSRSSTVSFHREN